MGANTEMKKIGFGLCFFFFFELSGKERTTLVRIGGRKSAEPGGLQDLAPTPKPSDFSPFRLTPACGSVLEGNSLLVAAGPGSAVQDVPPDVVPSTVRSQCCEQCHLIAAVPVPLLVTVAWP